MWLEAGSPPEELFFQHHLSAAPQSEPAEPDSAEPGDVIVPVLLGDQARLASHDAHTMGPPPHTAPRTSHAERTFARPTLIRT